MYPGSHTSPRSGPYNDNILAQTDGLDNTAYESLDPPTHSNYINDHHPVPAVPETSSGSHTASGSTISPRSGPYDDIIQTQTSGHQNPAYESLDPPTGSSYINDPLPSPYTALNPFQTPKPGTAGKLDHRGRNPVQDMDVGEYIHTAGSPNHKSQDYIEIRQL